MWCLTKWAYTLLQDSMRICCCCTASLNNWVNRSMSSSVGRLCLTTSWPLSSREIGQTKSSCSGSSFLYSIGLAAVINQWQWLCAFCCSFDHCPLLPPTTTIISVGITLRMPSSSRCCCLICDRVLSLNTERKSFRKMLCLFIGVRFLSKGQKLAVILVSWTQFIIVLSRKLQCIN